MRRNTKRFITEIRQGIFSCIQTHAREFDRGHPAVLILTNNIEYFSSDTTRVYIHSNVITGLLVSVSQNHLSRPQY